ncbi:peptide-methionine (R)-S-oxide reductase MsrB [Aquimarina aquimarini]|uniref:peptide-methionine (R)-S-oxide reductase MsrB n=1 Tax=Aquimarina aquimarini TaxID=1191734 RepID=UPI000D55205E|nr:peptide-methionine (R)-S-oxide reductase MsrB [Aquimarina aquimarini]
MSKYPVQKSEGEWKEKLTDEQYRVLRQKGTERPFTGEYNMHFEEGVYTCMACDTPLFKSVTKFDSGCGWPSFDESIEGNVEYIRDTTHGMIRTEIVCTNCGSHLGHVFNDGPTTTGQRYCVNSISINFDKK